MLTYTNIRYSDFFSFFNVSEVKRERTEDGLTTIHLKPGGFQEHIDIRFRIDSDELLRESYLLLDRSWIGNEVSLNVFAKDIAKSFLNDIVHPEHRERMQPFVDMLFTLRGTNDISITTDGSTPPSIDEINQPDLKEIGEVFVGKRDAYEVDLGAVLVVFENIVSDHPRLKISLVHRR